MQAFLMAIGLIAIVAEQPVAIRPHSASQPSAAVVEAAYLQFANRICERLIDVCPDDALVSPVAVRADAIQCKVKSDRATCRFAIERNMHRQQCRGIFRFVRERDRQFWAVAYERNRPWLKPKIQCRDG